MIDVCLLMNNMAVVKIKKGLCYTVKQQINLNRPNRCKVEIYAPVWYNTIRKI